MKKTFTKKMVIVLLFVFIVWITWSYVLASLGHDQIAEELSSQVVIVGVATILGYLCKAFLETNAEEKIKLEKEILKETGVELVNDDDVGE